MLKKGNIDGFIYEVDTIVLDDMELMDAIAAAQGEDPLQISTVVLKVLGKEQRKKLYDHLRTEDGRVPTEAVSEIVGKIMENLGTEGKN